MQDFTKEMRASGGDFTISFWVRPVGPSSLMGQTGRFFPHINFLSSVSPPQHQLLFGKWVNPNGEGRINSKCRSLSSRDTYWNVEIKEVSKGGWTFFAISSRNRTSAAGQSQETRTLTNLGTDRELADFPICLFNDTSFFSAIEINYPLLITPIRMVAEVQPLAKAQEHFLRHSEELSIRTGPRVANADRVESTIPVDKKEFPLRSILMASPIIFQTRAEPSSDCRYRYSSSWVERQHEKAIGSRCSRPFECDENVMSSAFSVMSCPGAEPDSELAFGLKPIELLGAKGYADFLYSLTDSQFVSRNNSAGQQALQDTSAFVDSLTQTVTIALVFFTPVEGLTSVLTINADFASTVGAKVTFEVKHYGILEDSKLYFYLVVQSLVLINVLFLILDAVSHLVSCYQQNDDEEDAMELLEPLTGPGSYISCVCVCL